jgi:hypothetical protein
MENAANGGRKETVNHVETQLATKNQYAILGDLSMGKWDEVDVDPNHNITSITPLEVASQDLEGDGGDPRRRKFSRSHSISYSRIITKHYCGKDSPQRVFSIGS